jgi:Leucine Rich repeat
VSAAGAEWLADCLDHLPCLTSLDLARNHLGDVGASALGLALQRAAAPPLASLSAQHSGVAASGALGLAAALRASCVLRRVDLRGNAFAHVRVRIRSMLADCHSHEVSFLMD